MPPREVRIPAATSMPSISSGVVSALTKMTEFLLLPCPAFSTASSAVNTICPTAAPGDAGNPVARTSIFTFFSSNRGTKKS